MFVATSRRFVFVLLAIVLIATTLGCAEGTFEHATSPSSLTVSVAGTLVAIPTNTTVGVPVTLRTDAEGTGLTLDACLAGMCRDLALTGGEATFVPTPREIGECTVTLRRNLATGGPSVVLASTKVVVK